MRKRVYVTPSILTIEVDASVLCSGSVVSVNDDPVSSTSSNSIFADSRGSRSLWNNGSGEDEEIEY